MTETIDIECPSCGKTIRSNVDICPYCCAHLSFHDLDDLEKVANGMEIEERVCSPETDEQGEVSVKKGFIGKLFGRGKK